MDRLASLCWSSPVSALLLLHSDMNRMRNGNCGNFGSWGLWFVLHSIPLYTREYSTLPTMKLGFYEFFSPRAILRIFYNYILLVTWKVESGRLVSFVWLYTVLLMIRSPNKNHTLHFVYISLILLIRLCAPANAVLSMLWHISSKEAHLVQLASAQLSAKPGLMTVLVSFGLYRNEWRMPFLHTIGKIRVKTQPGCDKTWSYCKAMGKGRIGGAQRAWWESRPVLHPR